MITDKVLNPDEEEYLDWIIQKVGGGLCLNPYTTYHKLFRLLYMLEFRYIIPRDNDRYSDGINLRYRFTIDNKVSNMDRLEKPCSVLEMIAALAIRLEENILDNPAYGDRTSQWFWEMLWTMEISSKNDMIFDEKEVISKVERFINREYQRNGKGGLFLVRHTDVDMRKLDIWSQAMEHINEMFY